MRSKEGISLDLFQADCRGGKGEEVAVKFLLSLLSGFSVAADDTIGDAESAVVVPVRVGKSDAFHNGVWSCCRRYHCCGCCRFVVASAGVIENVLR